MMAVQLQCIHKEWRGGAEIGLQNMREHPTLPVGFQS